MIFCWIRVYVRRAKSTNTFYMSCSTFQKQQNFLVSSKDAKHLYFLQSTHLKYINFDQFPLIDLLVFLISFIFS